MALLTRPYILILIIFTFCSDGFMRVWMEVRVRRPASLQVAERSTGVAMAGRGESAMRSVLVLLAVLLVPVVVVAAGFAS